jgi:hypothetical protein
MHELQARIGPQMRDIVYAARGEIVENQDALVQLN